MKLNKHNVVLILAILSVIIPLSNTHAQNTPVGADRAWLSSFGYNDGWYVDRHPRVLADVNGDGMDDIVGFPNSGIYVSISTGSRYMPEQKWSDYFGYNDNVWRTETTPRFLADIDGDGMDDFVGFHRQAIWISRSTGSGFATPERWMKNDFTWGYDTNTSQYSRDSDYDSTTETPRYLADVNGDKKADIVGFGPTKVQVALSDGSTFNLISNLNLSGYNFDVGGFKHATNPRFVTDVNGDGLADIVAISYTNVNIHLSQGDNGFSETPSLVINDYSTIHGYVNVTENPRYIADMDGNGVKDIIGFADDGIYVTLLEKTSDSLSLEVIPSSSFDPLLDNYVFDKGWTNSEQPRFVRDVNGDGRADVVGFSKDGVLVSYSKDADNDGLGDELTPAKLAVSAYGTNSGGWSTTNHVRLLGDVDGNGRADIVGFHNDVLVSRFITIFPEDCILQRDPDFNPENYEDYDEIKKSLCVFD